MMILAPAVVLAEPPKDKIPEVKTPTPEAIAPSGKAAIDDPLGGKGIQYLITAIFNIAYGIAGLVAVAYLIVGGYQFVTSSGNPDSATAAKSTITNAIIGLIIILVSYLVIRFALTQLQAGSILG